MHARVSGRIAMQSLLMGLHVDPTLPWPAVGVAIVYGHERVAVDGRLWMCRVLATRYARAGRLPVCTHQ